MIRSYHLKKFILFLITFLCPSQVTYSLTYEELLKQTLKPTVSQVKELIDNGVKIPNPHVLDPSHIDISSLADLIARIEWYFPGATWAPIGRDVGYLGDLIDTFYLSIGQKGRVSRLNCSNPTLKTATHREIVSFLKDAGLDLDHIDKNPPFIMFDRTSYSLTSQSTKLICAGYKEYVSRGGNPKDLIRKFFLWTKGTTNATPPDFLEIVSESLTQETPYPKSILKVPMPYEFMHTQTSEFWHAAFGNFTRYTEGIMMAKPGAPKTHEYRQHIVYEQSLMIKKIFNSSFLKLVKTKARELGFEFPTKRIYEVKDARIVTPREQAEDLKDTLERIVSELHPVSHDKGYLSLNGDQLKDWLESAQNFDNKNALFLLFIETLCRLHEVNKISDKDFRRLLARTIGKLSFPDDEFLKRFVELYKRSPVLVDTLNRKRDVFINSKQPDQNDVKKGFLYLETEMASQCAIHLLETTEASGEVTYGSQ